MDVSDLKSWLGAIALFLSIGTTLYTFVTFRSKNNSGKLTDLEGKVIKNTTDIAKMENEFKHLPDSEDVVELKLAISKLDGVVGRLEESMSGMSRTVRRTEDFLMSKGN